MMKTNFAKFYHAIGFPRFPSYYKCKRGLISTPKIDENDDDCPLAALSSNHDDSNIFEPHSSITSYNSWLMKYPSALESFYLMMNSIKGKIVVVFLDYDGTLSPIVDNPDRAFISDEMRSAIHEVAKCFPTAIISGRSRDKVKEFVQLTNVFYVGSHGMDIMAPPKQPKSYDGKHPPVPLGKEAKEVLFQPAKKFLPAIKEIYKMLKAETSRIQGVMLEDNRFCISVHFRQVQQEDYIILQETVKAVLENYPEFLLSGGKKVIEIRPSIQWNKGHAMEYLLQTLRFNNSTDVFPLYIGDDRTDEDAFKVIRNRGQGYPIVVSSIPKETKASYSLRDPSDVLLFLLRLAKGRKNSPPSSWSLA